MAIKIGHASLGENGTKNNAKGDQTGKEVCVRNWYNGGWHTVLRCKDVKKAEKMAKACEAACANVSVGYDQNQRNTLRSEAQKHNFNLYEVDECECDCSSLMSVCAECAGIKIPYTGSNAPVTKTMVKAFTSTGEFEALKDPKYLTTDKNLKRGDILVKDGHTVMALQNGANASFVLVSVKCPTLKKGCKGEPVRALQAILNAKGYDCGKADGDFGAGTEKAVKAFQTFADLDADGVIGADTWNALLN